MRKLLLRPILIFMFLLWMIWVLVAALVAGVLEFWSELRLEFGHAITDLKIVWKNP